VEAVAAVARFGFLPRFCNLVNEGLRGAVKRRCPLPVAAIGSQAGQPEAGAGETGVLRACRIADVAATHVYSLP
jgi:hypothetical protein